MLQITCLTPINAINKIKWHLITLHHPSGDGSLIPSAVVCVKVRWVVDTISCRLRESEIRGQGNQRFFSFSSPLRDSLSPLCGSLSLSRTKFSRKTSGTRVSVCPFVFAGMVHDNFSNCSSVLVPRLKVTKRRALEMRDRRTCAYEQRRKLAPRQHVDPIFLRWNNLIHIIMYTFNSMRHLCDV